MIAKDQPTIFGGKIIAGCSSVDDGNIKKYGMPSDLQLHVTENQKKFLEQLSIELEQTVLVRMSYDKVNFANYKTVTTSDKGKGIIKDDSLIFDALATRNKNIALFLPIADCVGAIIYDPKKEVLMVSHLGRHATEQHGGTKCIEYMQRHFGSRASDILVWLSPAADGDSYPLFAFQHKSLHEVNREHFVAAGILPENIETSKIDTATDQNYFSHSQFLRGNRQVDGRFAIVAMLK